MARAFFVNGESLVQVKGSQAQASIASLAQLGLAEGPISLTPDFRHKDINVDAWGAEIPADVQWMLASIGVSMTLIHFDRDILDACLMEAMGGAGGGAIGQMGRAGRLMGGNADFGAANNHYIQLSLTSPVGNKPWRFFFAYLTGPPMEFPLGTEKSIVTLNWRVIPYTLDPYGGYTQVANSSTNTYQGTSWGTGAQGYTLWDHQAAT